MHDLGFFLFLSLFELLRVDFLEISSKYLLEEIFLLLYQFISLLLSSLLANFPSIFLQLELIHPAHVFVSEHLVSFVLFFVLALARLVESLQILFLQLFHLFLVSLNYPLVLSYFLLVLL